MGAAFQGGRDPGRGAPPVRAPAPRFYHPPVPPESLHPPRGPRVPHFHSPVLAARGQQPAVRAVSNAENSSTVSAAGGGLAPAAATEVIPLPAAQVPTPPTEAVRGPP